MPFGDKILDPSQATTNSGTSLQIGWGGTPSVGHGMVVRAGTGAADISISNSGYTPALDCNNTTESDRLRTFLKKATASEDASVTVTVGAADEISLKIQTHEGLFEDLPGGIDLAESENRQGSGTSLVISPADATDQASELALAQGYTRNGSNAGNTTLSDGFTEDMDVGTSYKSWMAGHKVLTSAGVVTTTMSFPNSAVSIGGMCTWREAVAPAASPPVDQDIDLPIAYFLRRSFTLDEADQNLAVFVTETPVSSTIAAVFEALAAITATRASALEALSNIAQPRIALIEALAAVIQARTGNVETLGHVNVQTVPTFEALTAILQQRIAVFESLSTAAAIATISIEALAVVSGAVAAAMESTASLVATRSAGIESLAALAKTDQATFESLGDARAARTVNFEALGFAVVAHTAVIPFEARGTVLAPGVFGYESLAAAGASSTIAIESLAVLTRTTIGELEVLASISVDRTANIETLAAVAGDATLSHESLRAIARAAGVPFEALQSGVVVSVVNLVERVAYFQIRLGRDARFGQQRNESATFAPRRDETIKF